MQTITLSASITEEEVFEDPLLLKVWIWALSRVATTTGGATIRIGRGTRHVETGDGQFVYTRRESARQLDLSPATLERRVEELEMLGYVELERESHYSILSVPRWHKYVDHPEERSEEDDPHQSAIPYDEVKRIWNAFADHVEVVSNIRTISDKRRRKIRTRWKEWEKVERFDDPLQYFRHTLHEASKSKFLMGDNDRGWTMNFNWLIRNEENFLKIWEGNFKDKSNAAPPKKQSYPSWLTRGGGDE